MSKKWLWLRKMALLLAIILEIGFAQSQTFHGAGGAIPDNGNPGLYSLEVSALNPGILGNLWGLESVCINISHNYTGSLRIRLIAPNGENVLLTDCLGWDGHNFTNCCFRDDASESILFAGAPFTGTWKPFENLGYHNNGQNANGIWKLWVLDKDTNWIQGTVLNWSITFGNQAGAPFPFTSSNLPIVKINTNGQEIMDDPKIMANFEIIDNGTGVLNHPGDAPAYMGYIGVELRGSSSQTFPKKSYGFETWDELGNEIDTTLLGMPAESDWILNANYSDKTLMRNALAYQIWQEMGHYATRYRFVELMLNNRYKGVYILSEKIKRDKNRVNIAKMSTSYNSGDNLTGGYIVKIDKMTGSGGDGWTSNFPPPAHPNGQYIYFQYEYPKAEDITPVQKAYIQNYVDAFEMVLEGSNFQNPEAGWRKYAVENTFIDYFIENEFSKNVDGYRLSTFLHKERDSRGGKLRMGPIWDYDLAWKNADYCGGNSYIGWAYQFPCPDDWWQVPFWWSRLLEDSIYTRNLRCRWNELRQSVLHKDHLYAYIDSIAFLLDGPQQRNFQAWPILGHYVWPNPWPISTTYQGEILNLKNFIDMRLTWLDYNMPGDCWNTGIDPQIHYDPVVCVFSNGMLNINWKNRQFSQVELFTISGSRMLVSEIPKGVLDLTLPAEQLKSGLYIVRLTGEVNTAVAKVMVH
ncbi:MAG: hypothetical protein PWP35_792 [Bacteroidales bacterium]|jgi:subtilisin-like proprotein convertase family protein|nr:hypothetical protein [Bacteroidales bacterium]